jgi:hypothetical protein
MVSATICRVVDERASRAMEGYGGEALVLLNSILLPTSRMAKLNRIMSMSLYLPNRHISLQSSWRMYNLRAIHRPLR